MDLSLRVGLGKSLVPRDKPQGGLAWYFRRMRNDLFFAVLATVDYGAKFPLGEAATRIVVVLRY